MILEIQRRRDEMERQRHNFSVGLISNIGTLVHTTMNLFGSSYHIKIELLPFMLSERSIQSLEQP